MSQLILPGELNGHALSIVLREAVKRAFAAIRRKRFNFEYRPKPSAYKTDDQVTDADTDAQRIIVRALTECFPGYGIVAEEGELARPCTLEGVNAFFTVDPLDGTKAFVRRQSHGVGTMISLVIDGSVACAYVGDVNTQEIYGYRPGSEKVHRLTEDGLEQTLSIDPQRPIGERHILLRDPASDYTLTAQKIIAGFKSNEVGGGSIGVAMARLWKDEVGAVFMRPFARTPWDTCPILGISRRLGIEFLWVSPTLRTAGKLLIEPVAHTVPCDFEILAVHASRLKEIEAAVGLPLCMS